MRIHSGVLNDVREYIDHVMVTHSISNKDAQRIVSKVLRSVSFKRRFREAAKQEINIQKEGQHV